MKKRVLFSITAVLLLIFLLASCDGTGAEDHTVTFVLGGGRPSVTVEVSADSELYEPDPPSEGYIFAGWFLDEGLTRPFLSGNISEDMTLYARVIERGERVVTFIYGNGTPDTTLVIDGALTEPPSPKKEGCVFTGWNDAASGEPYTFGKAPTAAHTVIVATWRETSEGVRLTFHPENGSEPTTVSYAYAAKPAAPDAPRNEGFDFMGWYTSPECNELFDFDEPLTADAHAYAGWYTDLASVGNMIAHEVLPSTVKIHTTRTNMSVQALSLGSGVIYAKHSGYYYALTNAHVVEPYAGYYSTTYKVYDAYGNEYVAQRMAMDASYDLAVIRFAVEKDLPVATLAKDDPAVGSLIISVGSPGSLSNCVTYGKVTKYAVASVQNGAVTFEVAWHDSPIYNGSSGGAVFNSRGEVVGINFAAATDNDTEEFIAGALIQRTRVAEFLTSTDMVFD